jgi:16S rRNA (guanine1516-N2)-methyltransferase
LTIQSNEDELLEVALKKAKDRVVVKRHKKVKNLSGLKPTFSLTGRVVRYDVYSIS